MTLREHAWLVTGLAMVATLTGARLVYSANALSFPPTSFAILSPDTGIAIGRSRYRIDSAGGGATLRGENNYFDDSSDVETSRLLSERGALPKLVEFDHTFYKAGGSILMRAHLDFKSGAATCIDNTGGRMITQSAVLRVPDDTWAGASVVLPIQDFLRAGSRASDRPLHVFTCAPGPKIFAITVMLDPGQAVWTAYGAEAIRVEVRPDFGWLNLFAAAFVPKLHAWFDPYDGMAFIGDEAARYYKGPRIVLVKTHPGAPGEKRRN